MKTIQGLLIICLATFAGSALADPVLTCFVDTPAYDEYNSPNCMATTQQTGGGTTSADFLVQELNANHSYDFDWSDYRCNGVHCVVPIDPGQSIQMDVTVTDLNTMEVFETSATANYVIIR